jgi:hypothetical protein
MAALPVATSAAGGFVRTAAELALVAVAVDEGAGVTVANGNSHAGAVARSVGVANGEGAKVGRSRRNWVAVATGLTGDGVAWADWQPAASTASPTTHTNQHVLCGWFCLSLFTIPFSLFDRGRVYPAAMLLSYQKDMEK